MTVSAAKKPIHRFSIMGHKCEMFYRESGPVVFEWDPDPRLGEWTQRNWTKFWKKYKRERSIGLERIANMVGGRVLVVNGDSSYETIQPAPEAE